MGKLMGKLSQNFWEEAEKAISTIKEEKKL